MPRQRRHILTYKNITYLHCILCRLAPSEYTYLTCILSSMLQRSLTPSAMVAFFFFFTPNAPTESSLARSSFFLFPAP